MRISYESSAGFFRVELTGRMTVADLMDALCAVLGHARFRPGHNVLWDLRQADLRLLTGLAIRRVASIGELHRRALGSSRLALLLNPTADYTLGRMYHMLAVGGQCELAVFRDPAEAERWVGRRLLLIS
jgi:hypothetical protein